MLRQDFLPLILGKREVEVDGQARPFELVTPVARVAVQWTNSAFSSVVGTLELLSHGYDPP
ncbi:hypothetical protein A5634_07160 [Mycobacterium asiaticum]|uniref:Uncharacterized protein n=1 Tax=Mycobacterium asiaticum TaxID=1790 RepID=A0A1A3NR05_MYCAS|nr:hypothetical protein A5634_07160 [Mycobacterium asiaticum]